MTTTTRRPSPTDLALQHCRTDTQVARFREALAVVPPGFQARWGGGLVSLVWMSGPVHSMTSVWLTVAPEGLVTVQRDIPEFTAVAMPGEPLDDVLEQLRMLLEAV